MVVSFSVAWRDKGPGNEVAFSVIIKMSEAKSIFKQHNKHQTNFAFHIEKKNNNNKKL